MGPHSLHRPPFAELSTLSFANGRLDFYNVATCSNLSGIAFKVTYGLGSPPPKSVIPLVSCRAAVDKFLAKNIWESLLSLTERLNGWCLRNILMREQGADNREFLNIKFWSVSTELFYLHTRYWVNFSQAIAKLSPTLPFNDFVSLPSEREFLTPRVLAVHLEEGLLKGLHHWHPSEWWLPLLGNLSVGSVITNCWIVAKDLSCYLICPGELGLVRCELCQWCWHLWKLG